MSLIPWPRRRTAPAPDPAAHDDSPAPDVRGLPQPEEPQVGPLLPLQPAPFAVPGDGTSASDEPPSGPSWIVPLDPS